LNNYELHLYSSPPKNLLSCSIFSQCAFDNYLGSEDLFSFEICNLVAFCKPSLAKSLAPLVFLDNNLPVDF